MANNIELDLLFETRDAIKNLEKFTKESQRSANVVESSFKTLTAVAVGFVGIFATQKLFGFFEGAVEASAEAEAALNSLNSALAISGNFSQEASKSFADFASQLQATTTLEDDAIIRTGALIESLTNLDSQGLQKATQAAADLSVAIGVDLDSASRLIAKGIEGNTAAFKRYGIEVKKGANDTENFANVIDALNTRFGGAAANQIFTYAGAITQAKNAFGDILEEIGSIITTNPAVIAGINAVTKAFIVIKKTIEDNKGAIIDFIRDGVITLIEIIPDLLQSLDFVNRAFLKFQQTTAVIKTALNSFSGFVAKLGAGKDAAEAITQAVDEDNIAIVKNTELAEQNADARSKAILNIVSKSRKIVDTTVEQIKANSDETKSFVKNNQVKLGLIKELSEEQIKAQEALRKKEAERIEKLSTLNLKGLEGNFNINVVLPKDTEGQIALGLGGLNKALEGAKGATELIASGAGAIANTFLPGIGAAVQQLVSVLAQGPAAVQALISAFIQQIPVIIQNVILAIPAVIQAFVDNLPTFIQALVNAIPTIITGLIEAVPRLITSIIDNIPIIIQNLADQLPVVIERLVERVPEIITAIIMKIPEIIQAIITKIPTIAIQFGTSLAAQAPFIATQFAIGFVKEIPTIAKGIAEAIPKAVAGAAGDVGKGIGGVVGGIGKLFGFADGGGVDLPQGDTLLAGFNAGETVINERQTQRFNQLLDRIEARTDQPAVQQQSDNRPLIINLQVGEKQLADVILNLNRNGFRLA